MVWRRQRRLSLDLELRPLVGSCGAQYSRQRPRTLEVMVMRSKGKVTGETLIKKRFYMYIRHEVDRQMKARKNDADSSGSKWEEQQMQQRRTTSRVMVFNVTDPRTLRSVMTLELCSTLRTRRHWVVDNVSMEACARDGAVCVPAVHFFLGCHEL